MEAFCEMGLSVCDLYSKPSGPGVSYSHVTLDRGWRTSSYQQFAHPQVVSGKLKVISSALVTKLLMEKPHVTGRWLLSEAGESSFMEERTYSLQVSVSSTVVTRMSSLQIRKSS